MPELPEMQIISDNLKKMILDKNISSVKVYNTHKINAPDQFCKALTGTSIKDIVRDGKELKFLLTNDNCFNVHLMLNGKLSICPQNEVDKINGKISALFFEDPPADAIALTIADFQELCKVTLNPRASTAPDALSDTFTFEYFSGALKRYRMKNIKAVLIDQNFVRGIGNAYVDEILWKADISPESVAGKIPEDKVKDLYQAIPLVLNEAIQNIKKISPDIISGEERSFLQVHHPAKKYTDNGGKIIVKTVASKKTYFTNKQKLYV